MTFHLRGNGGNYAGAEWIAAEGEIVSSTADDLEKFFENSGYSENPGGWSVRLNSPGGDLAGGLRLGKLIRRLKLDTEVGASEQESHGFWRRTPGIAASACAFAFLGGLSREVSEGELGVHQFYDAIALENPSEKVFNSLDVSNHQFISALLIDYAVSMGVDPRFVAEAASTPPEKMRFLDSKRLEDLNVRWQPNEFEPWSIEPFEKGVIAITKTKGRTQTAKFFCRSDGVPTLLISPIDIDRKWLEDAMDTIQSVSAFDLTFPRNALSLKMIDDNLALEFSLDDVNGTTIASAKWPGVGVDGPRYMWSAFSYTMPRQNAEAAIRIALKNSI